MVDEKPGENGGSNINYKAIHCEYIPERFLDKLIAKSHFGKFGKIERFILRPNRLSCTVEYATKEEGEYALASAGVFNGQEFSVRHAEFEVAHVQNTEEWVNPEVQAELEALVPVSTGKRFIPPARPTTFSPPPSRQRLNVGSSQIQQKTQKASVVVDQPKLDPILRNELETILQRQAISDEEKYRVLDARDKFLRLSTHRKTDIKKAEITKGTCPDMCPEKERLMRSFQRQASIFEVINDDGDNTSGISHRLAVKEYSRSSADQEAPLAHELRPESVLKMTMMYLLHHIMDLCNDPSTSMSDWFHFVWDRTRSIRKDITQQALCSLGAVELVEQCARFHIHCAARLVAEDSIVFDKKINAENLTKCLQTLKYMYHDLRLKKVLCPCESEFRSYIVLLNLGNSNFLWELKQLPSHIQNSKEIKHAIAVYNALQHNNYVRFFNLVRSSETSYLSACILLGYFDKLRYRAMEAIIKSHNWRKNGVYLPMAYLTKVLGFEDENDAADFFSYHGLQCYGDRVLLDRIRKPDIEYSMSSRAKKLVESKLLVSVGESVCGHPLGSCDIFEKHQPHNSFTDSGFLKSKARTAEDQLGEEASKLRSAQGIDQQQQQPSEPSHPQPLLLEQQIKFPPKQQPVTTAVAVSGSPATLIPTQASIFNIPYTQSDLNIFKIPQVTPAKQQQPPQPQPQPKPNNDQEQNLTFFGIPKVETNTNSKGHTIFSLPTGSESGLDTGFLLPAASERSLSYGNIFKPITAQISQTKQPDQLELTNASNTAFNAKANQLSQFSFIAQSARCELPTDLKAVSGSVFKNLRVGNADEVNSALKIVQKTAQDLDEAFRRNQEQLELERKKLKELEEERLRAKKEAHRQSILNALVIKAERETEDFINVVLLEEVEQVVQKELQRYEKMCSLCQETCNEFLYRVICEQVEDIAKTEYTTTSHVQLLSHQYFDLWLRKTRWKIANRNLLEDTPKWVSTLTREEQVNALQHPSQMENLHMIKRYRHGEPCDFAKLLWEDPQPAYRVDVNLFQIIDKHCLRKQNVRGSLLQVRRYFKLLITLPTDNEELHGFGSLCNKWLKTHVYVPQSQLHPERRSTGPYICALENDVALCVRKLSGVKLFNEQGSRLTTEGDHADAIICFMSGDNVGNTRDRLHAIFKSCNIEKAVPLAILLYHSSDFKEQLAETLELNELVEAKKLLSYKFLTCSENSQCVAFPAQFRQAVDYTVCRSSICGAEKDEVEMLNLYAWIEATLGHELWERLRVSSSQNVVFGKICNLPQYIVDLFNEAVHRLGLMAPVDFTDLPQFPEELKAHVPDKNDEMPDGLEYFPVNWKNNESQPKVPQFLKKLEMPNFELESPYSLDAVQASIVDYCFKCIPDNELKALVASHQAVQALLEQLNRRDLGTLRIGERFKVINYLSVIKAVAFAHINHVLENAPTTTLPEFVIYYRRSYIDFQTQPWWLNNKAIRSVIVDHTENYVQVNEEEEAQKAAELRNKTLKEAIEKGEKAIRQAEACRSAQPVNTVLEAQKRSLDESFYEYEVAKQFGAYDLTFAKEAAQKIDAELDAFHDDQRNVESRKRKCAQTPDNEEDIIAKAMRLIERIENQQDELNQSKLLEHQDQ